MKRVFLAIDLPKDVVAGLKKHYDRTLPVRWTASENLHVTMNFLGDVDESRAEEVLSLTEEICRSHPPIDLALEFIQPFKYMVWATVKRNPELENLYRDLNRAFLAADLGREQHAVFRPHVCLARAFGGGDLQMPSVPCDFKFTATHVVVFESILKSGGPTYISLDAFELGGQKDK